MYRTACYRMLHSEQSKRRHHTQMQASVGAPRPSGHCRAPNDCGLPNSESPSSLPARQANSLPPPLRVKSVTFCLRTLRIIRLIRLTARLPSAHHRITYTSQPRLHTHVRSLRIRGCDTHTGLSAYGWSYCLVSAQVR